MKAHILTGGPCSGKTSVIKELQKRGFIVSEEVARKVHEERSSFPLNKNETLIRQLLIFQKQLVQEANLDRIAGERDVFFDRSLVDSAAYSYFLFGFDINNFSSLDLPGKYKNIFFFDRLPYVADGVRVERNETLARKIHGLLEKTYLGLGYTLTYVPIMSLKERADFILKIVADYQGKKIKWRA